MKTTTTTTTTIRQDHRGRSHHRLRRLHERSRHRRRGLRDRRPSSTSPSPNVARNPSGPPHIGQVLHPVRRRRQSHRAGRHHHHRSRPPVHRRRRSNRGVSHLRRGPDRRRRPLRARALTSSPQAARLRARHGPGRRRRRPLRARALTSSPRAARLRARRGPGRRRRPLRARALTSSPQAVRRRLRLGLGRHRHPARARTLTSSLRAVRPRHRLGPGRHRHPARAHTSTKSPRAARRRPQTGSRRHLLRPLLASRLHQHPQQRRPTRGWRSIRRCCAWDCPRAPSSSRCRPTESTRLRSRRSPTRQLRRLRWTGNLQAAQTRPLHGVHRRPAPRCHNQPQRAVRRRQRPKRRRPTRECRSIRRCCAWVCLQARWPSRCRPTGSTRQRSRRSLIRIRVGARLQPRTQPSGPLSHRPLAARSSGQSHLRAHRRPNRKLRARHKTHAM